MNNMLTANPITVITKFIPEDIIFTSEQNFPTKLKKKNLEKKKLKFKELTVHHIHSTSPLPLPKFNKAFLFLQVIKV